MLFWEMVRHPICWSGKNDRSTDKFCGAKVQDQGLKNLMMAWYFAGYYTGLYEGQRRAAQNVNPSSNANP